MLPVLGEIIAQSQIIEMVPNQVKLVETAQMTNTRQGTQISKVRCWGEVNVVLMVVTMTAYKVASKGVVIMCLVFA